MSTVMQAARLSAREAAKQETRQALLDAGLAEFLEHGLDNPSLDAICARAGYTRGAFYVHFEDREQFLVAVMEEVLSHFFDSIIATGAAASDLEETIQRYAAVLAIGQIPWGEAGSVRLFHLLDVCTRSPEIRQRFVQMIGEAAARVEHAAREGQQAGTVRADVGAAEIGILLVALAEGLVSLIDAGVRVAPEALRDAVLALLRPARLARPRGGGETAGGSSEITKATKRRKARKAAAAQVVLAASSH